MESTRDILRRFYTEVWEQGQFDRIVDYYHPISPSAPLLPDRAVDPREVREWMEILSGKVRDIKVTILHSITEGAWASLFLKVECQSRETNAPVTVYQQIMVRQDDGMLVESYPQFDLLRFFEQLEQLPENAYELLMAGTRLQ